MASESNTHATDLQTRIVRLLERAVVDSGRSHAEIARLAHMKRDSLRRSLNGDRPVSLAELIAILDASGIAGEQAVVFTLLAGEEFAIAQAGKPAAQFLGELFKRAPREIVEQLGEDADELRPRWAQGTAKLLAKTLVQHVADLNRRGDAVGERMVFG